MSFTLDILLETGRYTVRFAEETGLEDDFIALTPEGAPAFLNSAETYFLSQVGQFLNDLRMSGGHATIAGALDARRAEVAAQTLAAEQALTDLTQRSAAFSDRFSLQEALTEALKDIFVDFAGVRGLLLIGGLTNPGLMVNLVLSTVQSVAENLVAEYEETERDAVILSSFALMRDLIDVSLDPNGPGIARAGDLLARLGDGQADVGTVDLGDLVALDQALATATHIRAFVDLLSTRIVDLVGLTNDYSAVVNFWAGGAGLLSAFGNAVLEGLENPNGGIHAPRYGAVTESAVFGANLLFALIETSEVEQRQQEIEALLAAFTLPDTESEWVERFFGEDAALPSPLVNYVSGLAFGDDGNNIIIGSSSEDIIYGNGGADEIRGAGSDDDLYGGPGRDSLYGNAGDDRLLGGDDADFLDGGDGFDTLDGGPGDDRFTGGEVIFGGDGHDEADVVVDGSEGSLTGSIRIGDTVEAYFLNGVTISNIEELDMTINPYWVPAPAPAVSMVVPHHITLSVQTGSVPFHHRIDAFGLDRYGLTIDAALLSVPVSVSNDGLTFGAGTIWARPSVLLTGFGDDSPEGSFAVLETNEGNDTVFARVDDFLDLGSGDDVFEVDGVLERPFIWDGGEGIDTLIVGTGTVYNGQPDRIRFIDGGSAEQDGGGVIRGFENLQKFVSRSGMDLSYTAMPTLAGPVELIGDLGGELDLDLSHMGETTIAQLAVEEIAVVSFADTVHQITLRDWDTASVITGDGDDRLDLSPASYPLAFSPQYVDSGAGDDIIRGPGWGEIWAGSGADTIYANERDTIYGEAGDDIIFGDREATILGGSGNDSISILAATRNVWALGGAGDDIISAARPLFQNQDNRAYFSGARSDYRITEAARDASGKVISVTVRDMRPGAPDGKDTVTYFSTLHFSDGSVALANAADQVGSPTGGPDLLDGTDGDDAIQALGGNDVIYGSPGRDLIDGGTGVDQVDYGTLASGINAKLHKGEVRGAGFLDHLTSVEELVGTEHVDRIAGGDDTVRILGLGGDDIIRMVGTSDAGLDGGGGDDRIDGGSGNETVFGGEGGDRVKSRDGDDSVDLGDGHDIGRLGNGDDIGLGGDGDDRIYGGRGNDRVEGGDGDDRLYGGRNLDVLFGGAGDDSLRGGLGLDVLSGGAGDDNLFGGDTPAGDGQTDTFVFMAIGSGRDRIKDFEDGVDVIDLRAFGFGDFSEVLALSDNVGASNLRISFTADDSVVIENFRLHQLDVSDVILS